jgi:tRNA(fMet)-specific endonuclease VapC
MRYLLDTDIASYLIRNKDASLRARLTSMPPESVAISVITRAEMLYGLKRLPAQHHLHVGVRQFLKLIRTMPWDSVAADHYADIRHQLVSQGQPIGEMDMMIAAHSLSLGAVLVSNNTRHYQRIEAPLMLENWASATRDEPSDR